MKSLFCLASCQFECGQSEICMVAADRERVQSGAFLCAVVQVHYGAYNVRKFSVDLDSKDSLKNTIHSKNNIHFTRRTLFPARDTVFFFHL